MIIPRPDRPDSDIALNAWLEVARHHVDETGDVSALDDLSAAVAAQPGAGGELPLLIESRLEEVRSAHRPAHRSVEAWRDLRVRAEAQLAREHPTLMSIRLHEISYLQQRGLGDDLDRGVDMAWSELHLRREVFGDDNHWTRGAFVAVAKALRIRAGDDDMLASARMLREEIAFRRARYGDRHDFTSTARAELIRTLIVAAGREGGEDAVADGSTLADELVRFAEDRYGRNDPRTLNAHLLFAHTLLVSGEVEPARAELVYVDAVTATMATDHACRTYLITLNRLAEASGGHSNNTRYAPMRPLR
jgi:hypothetical protein